MTANQQDACPPPVSALSPIANSEGLSEHEIVALEIVAEIVDGHLWSHQVVHAMDRAGYTEIATSLSLHSLARKEYIHATPARDQNGNEFTVWTAAEAGFRWLEANQSKLILRKRSKRQAEPAPTANGEDIPF